METIFWIIAVVFLLSITVRSKALEETSLYLLRCQMWVRIMTNIHGQSSHVRIRWRMSISSACYLEGLVEAFCETIQRIVHFGGEIADRTLNAWVRRNRFPWRSPRTGGPLKPSVGLSGAVSPLERASRLLVQAWLPSIRTRSGHGLHSLSRTGENYSTPSLPGVRTIRASPDCDEYTEAFPQTADDCGC